MKYAHHGLSLQWRHDERDGVSNHHRLNCLLNRLFRHRSKKTSKFGVTGLCEGNHRRPPRGFPSQTAVCLTKGQQRGKCFHLMTSSRSVLVVLYSYWSIHLPVLFWVVWLTALLWRHNEHDSVSYHQPRGCLLDRLFRRRSKKTSKLRVTGLCAGNSPGPVNSPHKGPVTRKMFPFDDVIMHWDIIDAQHPMLGLYRIATNLGPIYELKNSGFLGLVSSR